jgi:hypothetical protein
MAEQEAKIVRRAANILDAILWRRRGEAQEQVLKEANNNGCGCHTCRRQALDNWQYYDGWFNKEE